MENLKMCKLYLCLKKADIEVLGSLLSPRPDSHLRIIYIKFFSSKFLSATTRLLKKITMLGNTETVALLSYFLK